MRGAILQAAGAEEASKASSVRLALVWEIWVLGVEGGCGVWFLGEVPTVQQLVKLLAEQQLAAGAEVASKVSSSVLA
jgi:anti-sigma factor RsiW